MLIFSMTVCHGGAVQWDVFAISDPYYDEWEGISLSVLGAWINGEQGGGVGIWFETQQTKLGEAKVINHFSTIGISLWLLEATLSSVVDYESMFINGSGFFQNSYSSPEGPICEPLFVPKTNLDESNTIFLAFAAGDLGNEWTDPWLRYGWIELGYKNGEIYIVNSAYETTGLGMLVGTSTVIPEPSTAFLTMSGCAFVLLRRRKRKITP